MSQEQGGGLCGWTGGGRARRDRYVVLWAVVKVPVHSACDGELLEGVKQRGVTRLADAHPSCRAQSRHREVTDRPGGKLGSHHSIPGEGWAAVGMAESVCHLTLGSGDILFKGDV